MAVTRHDARLATRNARTKLAARREPYWRSISEGLAIGYRKGSKGGTWIARHYSAEHGRRYQALGTADDVADADGAHVLSFAQAQEAARRWFADVARLDRGERRSGPYTVGDALDDYLKDYERRGGKGLAKTKHSIERHIRPAFGSIVVDRLSHDRIESWHHQLATTAPLVRTRKGRPQRFREFDRGKEALRRRRSTANRLLTIIKAALNHAYHRRRVAGAQAWQTVKPFRGADSVKVRYLTDDETKRLVNACPSDLRAMVTAALLTGARYGELAALRAADFNPDSGTLLIAESKSGKARHVVLTDEGRTFFAAVTAGKTGDEPIFRRSTAATWHADHQLRPMREACAAAKIKPAIGFHTLRHTYASRLAMRGVSMQVIATQLGHADTRMTEKHYAHLAPSYVSETVRAAFGELGIVAPSNVVPIGASVKC